ncbi:MAG: transglutaminase domain-containing protein [Alphaproteobacteria bacterium]
MTDKPPIISDFRRAGQKACRSRIGKNIRRGLFALLAASTFAKAPVYAGSPAPEPSKLGFTVGGYQEYTDPSSSKTGWLSTYQARYLQDSAELQAAMDDCTKNAPTCDPHVKAFADMLKLVKKVPDQLTQIEMVDTYLNTISYDYDEESHAKSDLDHHTFKQVLDLNKGVCDEVAGLKLFALEKLGFHEQNIRWVGEDVYGDGERADAHAVTAVRIGSQVWIMNLGDAIDAGNYTGQKAVLLVMSNSTVEASDTELNFSNHSFFQDYVPGIYLVPATAFNSTSTGLYRDLIPDKNLNNIPPEDRLAPKDSKAISLHTLEKYHFLPILLKAMSTAYHMQNASTELAAPPAPKKHVPYRELNRA